MHNWCTLEFGPEWWQTRKYMKQYQNPSGPVCFVVQYYMPVQNRRDSNSKCYFGSTTATKKKRYPVSVQSLQRVDIV